MRCLVASGHMARRSTAPSSSTITSLPFTLPAATATLRDVASGVRPVLQFTYWLNYALSDDNPFSYQWSTC